MNEDGYGASDKEQTLNDLEELYWKICNLAEKVATDYYDIDDDLGLGILYTLQEMTFTIDRKIEELREPSEGEG